MSVGAALVVLGATIALASKLPFLGSLPGDLRIQGKTSTLYFPIATCVLISIALTVLVNAGLWLFRRYFH